jgi:hypothetical protein
MSYIDKMNQERVHVFRQKMKSICYSVIIIRSNIIKIVFKLTRHLINSDSKHLKAANHCINHLYVIKYLIIRYSTQKMKSWAVRFRALIKKSRKKKCDQRQIRCWIERRHWIKRTIISRSLKKQLMSSLQMILIEKALKNIFLNCLMIWSTELSKIIHRLDLYHRSETSFDVTRWQKAHLMNTFLFEIEVWLKSKDNDLQR